MVPAPLCKTAIFNFIIDEALLKLRNVSSISRKRAQVLVEDKQITLKEYNKKALKINGWVKISKEAQYTEGEDNVKKGISNYRLINKEEVEKVTALNGELRCNDLRFEPNVVFNFEYIQNLSIDDCNYDYYSKCSFSKVKNLCLEELSSSQINRILSKIKQIDSIWIGDCSVSTLNFSLSKIRTVSLYNLSFSEKIDLPSNLQSLEANRCENIHFLRCNKVTRIDFTGSETDFGNSLDWIKNIKHFKIVDIDVLLEESIDYFPNSLRKLMFETTLFMEYNDVTEIKRKLPLLIDVVNPIEIKMAQELNLRIVNLVINETDEIFTIRPRKIEVCNENVKQLNKHPELFEQVEQLNIRSGEFNFGCLPEKIKYVGFERFSLKEDKFENFEENNWKFEKTEIGILLTEIEEARKILNSLTKVKKVKIFASLKELIKEYPQFEFKIVYNKPIQ